MKLRDLARPPRRPGEAVQEALSQAPLSPVRKFMLRLSAIFMPLVPALIACGLLTSAVHIALYNYPILAGNNLYQLLTIVSGTVFWSIHIFVGFNTAKEFGGTPVLQCFFQIPSFLRLCHTNIITDAIFSCANNHMSFIIYLRCGGCGEVG